VAERTIGSLAINGLTVRDAVVVAGVLVTALALLLWRRGPRSRLAAVVVIPAVIQLAVTGYAFAGRDGSVRGIEGATAGSFAERDWIDAAADGDVGWLNNQSRGPEATGAALHTLFWNSSIRSWAAETDHVQLPPPPPPIDALGYTPIQVDERTGAANNATGLRHMVASVQSPFLQLAARRIAGVGSFELIELEAPQRATWMASGLFADGYVNGETPARLWAFADGPLRVRLTFRGPPEGQVRLRAEFDGERRGLDLAPGETKTETFEACPRDGRATGTLIAVSFSILRASGNSRRLVSPAPCHAAREVRVGFPPNDQPATLLSHSYPVARHGCHARSGTLRQRR
jgi:hypothetical protein